MTLYGFRPQVDNILPMWRFGDVRDPNNKVVSVGTRDVIRGQVCVCSSARSWPVCARSKFEELARWMSNRLRGGSLVVVLCSSEGLLGANKFPHRLDSSGEDHAYINMDNISIGTRPFGYCPKANRCGFRPKWTNSIQCEDLGCPGS